MHVKSKTLEYQSTIIYRNDRDQCKKMPYSYMFIGLRACDREKERENEEKKCSYANKITSA